MKENTISALFAALTIGAVAISADETPDMSIYEARTFVSGDLVLNYRWAVPQNRRKGERYPLVVVLHGLGEKGNDNRKQLALGAPLATPHVRKNFPCFIILPQAEKEDFPSFGLWGNPAGKKLASQPTKPTRLTLELIDRTLAENPDIDRERVYLIGQSMGGSGVFEFLARRPDLFAAGAPVYLGGTPDACEIIARNKIPLRFMNDDQSIPFSFDALKKLGADVEYIAKYRGGEGHEGWTKHYGHDDYALLRWLFSVRKRKN